jgi:ABC-type cobalamin/Fe3+-siderophores transport system ATPase subunit
MLESLSVKNFTVFEAAQFDFAPGLNVIIGANGLGKSHLLKLGYSCAWVSHSLVKDTNGLYTRQYLQKIIADKLVKTFRPDSLGRLARRGQGRSRAEIQISFKHRAKAQMTFSFATNSKSEVALNKLKAYQGAAPAIFFPTKEVLSMYPGFASLYRDYHIEMDETYYDLCLALERPLLRGARYEKTRELLAPLEKILGGAVRNENGRFILRLPGEGNMEMPLVAEGMRKLASIAYLIANGSLMDKATLYWDEPETNLNPLLITKLAEILVRITQQGTQVIIATHSLFLLKELDLQLKKSHATDQHARFFALAASDDGVIVQAGASIEAVAPITALDAEIEQAERYDDLSFDLGQVEGKRNA